MTSNLYGNNMTSGAFKTGRVSFGHRVHEKYLILGKKTP